MSEKSPHSLQERAAQFPDAPGIYVMRDEGGKILYVGKANSLRKRVLSYFRRPIGYKVGRMMRQVRDIEIMRLRSEEEALLLECKFIKEFQPKFNVSLRDDKRFPMVRMGLDEPFGRFTVVRLKKDDNARYFGPYTDGTALRRTLKFLRHLFKIRSCNYRAPGPKEAKHCIYYHMKTCLAPCVGEVSPQRYAEAMRDACLLLEGNHRGLLKELKKRMKVASARQEFEKAGMLRDHIASLKAVMGRGARNIRWYARSSAQLEEGVAELQRVLGLAHAPHTIEAFDISNTAGNLSVASMVRFVGGRPSAKDYRKFKIREVAGIDDYRSLQEVVRRRYARLLEENRPLPDLILIDGGKGQLGAARAVLKELNMLRVPIVSLAKKQEEIFTPHSPLPIVLEADRPARYLVQRVRDEAHRFAIGFHKSLRAKRIRASILDDIPGVGPRKKSALLKTFSSVQKMRTLSPKDLQAVPGVSAALARDILKSLCK